jgi:hypothetical protein
MFADNHFILLAFSITGILFTRCEKENDEIPLKTYFEDGYIDFEVSGNLRDSSFQYSDTYAVFNLYSQSKLILHVDGQKDISIIRYSDDFISYINLEFSLDSLDNIISSAVSGVYFYMCIVNSDNTIIEISAASGPVGVHQFDNIEFDLDSKEISGDFMYQDNSVDQLNGHFSAQLFEYIY